MFGNISQFHVTSDYLPILNGILITDIVVILFIISNVIKSKTIKIWYEKYNLSAVMADVLVILIVFIITRYCYPLVFGNYYSIVTFIALAVGIQVIHDILFYLFFSNIPRNRNKMLDFFKDYADENGYMTIVADSAMIILSALISSVLVSRSLNMNIIILVTILYTLPYLIYN